MIIVRRVFKITPGYPLPCSKKVFEISTIFPQYVFGKKKNKKIIKRSTNVRQNVFEKILKKGKGKCFKNFMIFPQYVLEKITRFSARISLKKILKDNMLFRQDALIRISFKSPRFFLKSKSVPQNVLGKSLNVQDFPQE